MEFCGLQKLSLVDYPGLLAATVFTGGCNLRCPFCHNALLVLTPQSAESLSEHDVLAFLQTRRGLLDGVVLSGGEPLLHSGVAEFAQAVRELGFRFKLDTNGTLPDRLQTLLERGVLDYVAMDIKNAPARYAVTAGVSVLDLAAIEQSIDLLLHAGIPYEFRTTLVREFHTEDDIDAIGRWISGAERYVLQTFVDSGGLIGSGMHAFTPEQMHAFADRLRGCVQTVEVRGIS